MKIATRTRYGFRFMVFLAGRGADGKRVQLHKAAEAEDISVKYLEQIAGDLKQNRLVQVRRGPSGGYTLARPAAEVTALEILNALETNRDLVTCTDSLETCGREPYCAMARFWQDMDTAITDFFQGRSLADIARFREEGR